MDNNILKIFLKSILDNIENGQLTQTQQLMLSEFYLRYKFNNDCVTTEHDDFIKFLTLGWYIYSHQENPQIL